MDITSTGFPIPNTTRQYSPALQKQISLLTADKVAEYFLFDDSDKPVRVVLYDIWKKMNFRTFRTSVWSGDDDSDSYMAAMAQYLIKLMGRKPGLSREKPI